MKFILYLFLLLIVVFSVSAQKVKPTLNLIKGATYNITSTSSSVVLQTINTEYNKINSILSFKMAFKVTDIVDSVYNMEASYQSLSLIIHTAAGDIEMNSKTNENPNIQSQIVAAITNKPFSITIGKSGRIRSAENADKMIAGVFNSFTTIDTAKKAQMKSQFIQSFGAKALKETLEFATAIFPDGIVKKNKKWTNSAKLESAMIASLQTVYKLSDITSDSYIIHGEGTIATDNNAGSVSINGLPVKYHLTGTIVSDIQANKTTGWVSDLKSKQVMSGDFEIEDNPKVPGGISLPVTINNDQVTTGK